MKRRVFITQLSLRRFKTVLVHDTLFLYPAPVVFLNDSNITHSTVSISDVRQETSSHSSLSFPQNFAFYSHHRSLASQHPSASPYFPVTHMPQLKSTSSQPFSMSLSFHILLCTSRPRNLHARFSHQQATALQIQAPGHPQQTACNMSYRLPGPLLSKCPDLTRRDIAIAHTSVSVAVRNWSWLWRTRVAKCLDVTSSLVVSSLRFRSRIFCTITGDMNTDGLAILPSMVYKSLPLS